MREQVVLTPSEPVMLGHYRLLAELGSGGMANVYLAVENGAREPSDLVVLKVLRDELAGDRELVEMFLQEGQLASRLVHRNVVETFEAGRVEGRHVIVMEYLEGESLGHIVERARESGPPISREIHLRILSECLNGLHYAHELCDLAGKPLELVHRDVSPHNVFVTFAGRVKVLDFGIAKAIGSVVTTQAGTIKGKVRYMGPEQFAGEKLDRRADIYAMGCLLWDAAAGQRMWGRKGDVEIWKRVVHGVIPSPSTVNADVPPALEAIVMRALAKKREDRYPTCLDLKRELDAFLATRARTPALEEIGAYVAELFREQRSERGITVAERLGAAAPEDHHKTPSDTTSLPRLTYAPGPKRSDAPESGRDERLDALAKSLPARRHGRRSVSVAASAIAIGSVLAAVGLARREAPDATASGAEAPRDVRVRIEASPADAKLYLDDAPLDTNPSMAQRPRDALAHRIRGEAPGFAPSTVTVTFDRDVDVVLALERLAAPPK